MPNSWWNDCKWFVPQEFDSPDEPGSGEKYMNKDVVLILDAIRGALGKPLAINSGYRTQAHNKLLPESSPKSSHMKGLAVDVSIRDSATRMDFVRLALLHGIKRLGISSNFCHIDVDPDKQSALWLY